MDIVSGKDMNMKKILIYGTGRNGNLAYHYMKENAQIVGFVETHPTRKVFHGCPVFGIKEFVAIEWDEIYIANTHVETILALLDKGVPKKRIVICHSKAYSDYLAYNQGIPDVRTAFPLVLSRFLPDMGDILLQPLQMFGSPVGWHNDYCRFRTLKLLADEIKCRDINGDIAELGVLHGDFAAVLNRYFPDRRLFLFDTFEGFSEKDLEQEKDCGYYEPGVIGDNDFKDTNVQMVLDKMQTPSMCVVRKGRFPETIPGEERTYAFVSMDCDLYTPTLAGLEYFLPRLSPGGYIMLHDYNGEDFGKGTHRAVEACEKKYGHIVKVPLPDMCGTLVIGR